jgi:hypothetical protein
MTLEIYWGAGSPERSKELGTGSDPQCALTSWS